MGDSNQHLQRACRLNRPPMGATVPDTSDTWLFLPIYRSIGVDIGFDELAVSAGSTAVPRHRYRLRDKIMKDRLHLVA